MNREEAYDDDRDGVIVSPHSPLQGEYAGPGEDQVTTVAIPDDGDITKVGEGGEREVWGKKIDFLLSVIGFAVDLANVWRFPYLCYKNGGGAFLIPYMLMLICGGIPLFYMELALGQFNRTGAITCWARICPLFKGIGWAVVLIAFYTDFFYNVIIAWCLHFFISSFSYELPWTSCNNTWNTPRCYVRTENTSTTPANVTALFEGFAQTFERDLFNTTVAPNTTVELRRTPAEEYFERGMLELHESSGIFDVGNLKWQMVLCLLGVYLICYFSLWKGISTSGKVVWFTAIFPYVVLFILMVRGATLPGSLKGVKYYLTPNVTKLQEAEVWVDAATQVFFSLGPGFGVLLAYASYNEINNNVYRDALITSTINCLTSFFSGFVIFMILGYMSDKTGIDIKYVVTEGPGLIFIAYPEAIATLPWPTFWALIFFLMLLTLGLDSSFGGSEAILTALSDEFPSLKKRRELVVGLLFGLYFVVGLASCAQGGAYVVTLMDRFAAGYSILFAVFFEAIAVSWAYTAERFSGDIEMMVGFRPGIYWQICWKYIAPIFIVFNIVFGLVSIPSLKHGSYVYPWEASLIGWGLAMSSVLCIPGFAIYYFLRAKGPPMQRLRLLLTSTQPYRTTLYGNHVRLNGGMPGDPV